MSDQKQEEELPQHQLTKQEIDPADLAALEQERIAKSRAAALDHPVVVT